MGFMPPIELVEDGRQKLVWFKGVLKQVLAGTSHLPDAPHWTHHPQVGVWELKAWGLVSDAERSISRPSALHTSVSPEGHSLAADDNLDVAVRQEVPADTTRIDASKPPGGQRRASFFEIGDNSEVLKTNLYSMA